MGDPVERSDDLDRRIALGLGVTRDVENLMRASKRSLLLIRVLFVSVVFDVLLSVALGLVAIRADTAANQANSVQRRQVATCLAANEARAAQIALWTYILDLPSTAPNTPEQQQRIKQFRAFVATTFAPRKC